MRKVIPIIISTAIPKELFDRLEVVKEKMERGRSWIIRKAIEEYLNKLDQQ